METFHISKSYSHKTTFHLEMLLCLRVEIESWKADDVKDIIFTLPYVSEYLILFIIKLFKLGLHYHSFICFKLSRD